MLLFVLVLLVLVVYLYFSGKNGNSNNYGLVNRDKDWVKYLFGYKKVVKTESDKKLVDFILKDIEDKAILDAESFNAIRLEETGESGRSAKVNIQAVKSNASTILTEEISAEKNDFFSDNQDAKRLNKPQPQLDNTSILLFFGAFLFVASVGLFVAFSGVGGWLKTTLVLFVALSLYGIGLWLNNTKPLLKIAGLTFVGISIAIMPLVGVAAYSYIEGVSTSAIWFVTSVLCLLLYAHALVNIRKPLLNYVFLFTLLSTFESGVAMFQMPAYYFGWMMIAVGLMLQFISTLNNIWPDFKDSLKDGSQFYVPLSILISLAFIGSQGVGQLGVTLVLGAIFYGLEAWRSNSDYENRKTTSFVSHISLLGGIACIVYNFSHSIEITGMVLAGLTALQIGVVINNRHNSEVIKNFASVMLASLVVVMFLLAGEYMAMTVVLAMLVVESLFVWWWQKRDDAYVIAMAGWIILPNLLGIFAITPHLPINSLISLNIIALLLQVALFVFVVLPKSIENFTDTGRQTLLMQAIAVSVITCFAIPIVTLLSLSAISLVLLVLSLLDNSQNNYWEKTSGFIIFLSVLRSIVDPALLPSIMVALSFNILLALRFRSEVNRWLSTILWLALPIGFGGLTYSNIWTETTYAWVYLMVMVGLIISRAIARGVVFASSNIPLASYARTTSESYAFGYIVAGGLAFVISLFSSNSQLHTTAIASILSLIVFVLAWIIEKDKDLISIQPIIFQVILLSAIRPQDTGGTLIFYILASSALAIFCYLSVYTIAEDTRQKLFNSLQIRQIATTTSLIAPLSVMYAQQQNLAMPVGLAVTAVLLYNSWEVAKQSNKEISVGVLTLAFMWFIHILGVRNGQAYTHILALMFAGFAYWRYVINDSKQSDQYIYFALATSTIPLALQSISSDAGGVYGWWLIIEQVMFMIIGGIIHKKFVVMWGMYVAVGAVLYQLRSLGFVALAFLAVFVIGMAIYQLQRNNKLEDIKSKEDNK